MLCVVFAVYCRYCVLSVVVYGVCCVLSVVCCVVLVVKHPKKGTNIDNTSG